MSSLIEIQNQIALLQKQAEEIRAAELAATVADILGKMDAFGITLEDLERAKGRGRKPAAAAGKSGNPAPVKYRGPNGETWSGRGLMPRWLSALVAQGQSRESFAV
ncbi:H-NS histone family protein [Rhodoferax antarcticus]|uniref:H-NS histone family protein n=1 Tax=Rhodoferax antarcticus ANT.BR TaxID=1111071 RepID=A0A1Q8YK77_9BURK|nr:H-NS histone family protein [Rhodoferax antarcticus]APW47756.1 nucleoid-structuring protein H-NS [Rhodoferax antarcticus]MCW2312586.1 DNA-binding protein H-NS [Rhodoferax antarcticus]OLP08300.1 H-NS histone family protein [Rhodoferax antarcticus ANT.BR]